MRMTIVGIMVAQAKAKKRRSTMGVLLNHLDHPNTWHLLVQGTILNCLQCVLCMYQRRSRCAFLIARDVGRGRRFTIACRALLRPGSQKRRISVPLSAIPDFS